MLMVKKEELNELRAVAEKVTGFGAAVLDLMTMYDDKFDTSDLDLLCQRLDVSFAAMEANAGMLKLLSFIEKIENS